MIDIPAATNPSDRAALVATVAYSSPVRATNGGGREAQS
jgi:hypothetical protein